MGLNYENLDNKTREFMLEEVKLDSSTGTLYLSKRFNDVGKNVWASLLKEACLKFDDDWLSDQLREKGCMKSLETRENHRNSRITVARISSIAEQTFAEGEFNRYYCRGLCARAIEEKIPLVEVYRGKPVQNPRLASELKLGAKYDPKVLLTDLRASIGVETALGIPGGPNSGLTIRFFIEQIHK